MDKKIREASKFAYDDLGAWYGEEDLFDIAVDFMYDVDPEFASAYYSEIKYIYPDAQ